MVRAKFFCSTVTPMQGLAPDQVLVQVTLTAVWGDGKGNESWSKATPSGKIEMLITNPDAVDQFELGKSYYIDFTPAD